MAQKPKLGKEEILDALRNVAGRLGKDNLCNDDINMYLNGSISLGAIKRNFGNLGNALEQAGLRRVEVGENFRNRVSEISDDDLFGSIWEVERAMEHEPTVYEYTSAGRFSERPFRRFGGWREAMIFYRKWKAENHDLLQANGPLVSPRPIDLPVESVEKRESPRKGNSMPFERPAQGTRREYQIYGELINFRGLIHGPVNEQGVVYLFGIVSRELGFQIEAVQIAYPDCEGKVLADSKRGQWRKVFIEFDFKASNFKQHGHDPSRCDYIICWENDWPEAPVEVIELRSEILKLPST